MNKTYMLKRILFSSVLFSFWHVAIGQSVLAEGEWYQIAVVQDGIFQIDTDFWKKMGIDTKAIDPRNVHIFGYGDGMLPQPNDEPRFVDLPELAIDVSGESDGIWNTEDVLYFFAKGPDKKSWKSGTVVYEKNVYADTAYYYVTVNETRGKRIENGSQPNENEIFTDIYDDVWIWETEEVNLISSGRKWLGEQFSPLSTLTRTFEIDYENIIPASTVTISGVWVSQANTKSDYTVTLNQTEVGKVTLDAIPDPNNPNNLYDEKAVETYATLAINASELPNLSSGLSLTMTYSRGNDAQGAGYLDYVMVQMQRKLILETEALFFQSTASMNHTTFGYSIENIPSNTKIWDITDPHAIENETYTDAGTFSDSTNGITRSYVAFLPSTVPSPIYVGKIDNQNIQSITQADGLILYHPRFYEQAITLSEFHAAKDKMLVPTVNIFDIYREFASGRQDITALRDFVKYVYEKSNAQLKYVLLIGDCSYDYKNKTKTNENLIPVYESYNSYHPTQTYSSDDYIGFLEDDEGAWAENRSTEHTMEVGVGRLPVSTIEEAERVVQKIIRYTTPQRQFGNWKQKIVFIADDEDLNTHQEDADLLAQFVEQNYPSYHTQKIYLDSYEQRIENGNERSPAATQSIIQAINEGALIINYTGHGNEYQWSHETIFEESNISQFSNRHQLPLFVTATCDFGSYDEPFFQSVGEQLLVSISTGAIALVTTSRPVYSNTNYLLNRAFYTSLFSSPDTRLGDIIRMTKNNSTEGVFNRNFALLGDPMLQLSVPQPYLTIDSMVNNIRGDYDTLFRALGNYTIYGKIDDEDFNGIVECRLWDKPTTINTLSQAGNLPFSYDIQENLLFAGQAEVKNGIFDINIDIPKNISYQIGQAKLVAYAYDTLLQTDYQGYATKVWVGGSENVELTDITPPTIKAYVNDLSFNSGDIVYNSVTMMIKAQDERAINLANIGFGNTPQMVINDTLTLDISAYYLTDLESSESGWFYVPLGNLPHGKYQATVKISDIYNNEQVITVEWMVSDTKTIHLQQLMIYPNPVTVNSSLRFSHDRESEDLIATFSVFSTSGEEVYKEERLFLDTDVTIDNWVWTPDEMLKGLYFYSLTINSLVDGSTGQSSGKILIHLK